MVRIQCLVTGTEADRIFMSVNLPEPLGIHRTANPLCGIGIGSDGFLIPAQFCAFFLRCLLNPLIEFNATAQSNGRCLDAK